MQPSLTLCNLYLLHPGLHASVGANAFIPHMCIYTTLAKPLSIVDLAAQLVDFASYTKQLEAKHITRANALCMGKGFSLDRDVTIGWQ